METNDLIKKLKSQLSGVTFEARPFGRSNKTSLWIEMRNLVAIARALKEDAALSFDWLENLSAMEIDGAIVLTYFVRSSGSGETLLLRGSVVPKTSESEVDAPSCVSIWPMAAQVEAEIADLFGVRFDKSEGRALLPNDWAGYPLRKSYVFPVEYGNIPHMRPVGRTGPDEFGVAK